MIPVVGSAYSYSYASMGEFLAWTVGWALIMEYAVAAAAVSVGWSGYFSGTILQEFLGIALPQWLAAGPLAFGGEAGGFINLPGVLIALTLTSAEFEPARFNPSSRQAFSAKGAVAPGPWARPRRCSLRMLAGRYCGERDHDPHRHACRQTLTPSA